MQWVQNAYSGVHCTAPQLALPSPAPGPPATTADHRHQQWRSGGEWMDARVRLLPARSRTFGMPRSSVSRHALHRSKRWLLHRHRRGRQRGSRIQRQPSDQAQPPTNYIFNGVAVGGSTSNPTITTCTLPGSTVGGNYSQTLIATGGTGRMRGRSAAAHCQTTSHERAQACSVAPRRPQARRASPSWSG